MVCGALHWPDLCSLSLACLRVFEAARAAQNALALRVFNPYVEGADVAVLREALAYFHHQPFEFLSKNAAAKIMHLRPQDCLQCIPWSRSGTTVYPKFQLLVCVLRRFGSVARMHEYDQKLKARRNARHERTRTWMERSARLDRALEERGFHLQFSDVPSATPGFYAVFRWANGAEELKIEDLQTFFFGLEQAKQRAAQRSAAVDRLLARFHVGFCELSLDLPGVESIAQWIDGHSVHPAAPEQDLQHLVQYLTQQQQAKQRAAMRIARVERLLAEHGFPIHFYALGPSVPGVREISQWIFANAGAATPGAALKLLLRWLQQARREQAAQESARLVFFAGIGLPPPQQLELLTWWAQHVYTPTAPASDASSAE